MNREGFVAKDRSVELMTRVYATHFSSRVYARSGSLKWRDFHFLVDNTWNSKNNTTDEIVTEFV